uniref:Reverse transcriptase domain-containing protein n=1 Tax=Picea glauca TaxID=3330 RepID=A0A117NI22_PICGL|nr:hypothetical protein ABT39_MTgene3812 [Picea glauca]QHR87325.1 hypothetical protein Q903MT_gene1335 [Picea sitchensis]
MTGRIALVPLPLVESLNVPLPPASEERLRSSKPELKTFPPLRSIQHSIDLVPGDSFPNAPAYHLAPREDAEIERKLQYLLNSGHIHPSPSPCGSPSVH